MRGKTPDTFISIVHGKCNTITFKIIHFKLLSVSIFTFKRHGQFSFAFCYKISCTILITKCMTTNTNWCCPVRNQPWNIFTNDWLTKHSTIKNITDSSIWALPHLLKIKFFYTCFIRCNGCTFNTYTILFYCIGSINSYLVIGFITIFNTEIIIFNINIQIRKNQFVFNKFPDDACHFIAIQFYNRICYFNFLAHAL